MLLLMVVSVMKTGWLEDAVVGVNGGRMAVRIPPVLSGILAHGILRLSWILGCTMGMVADLRSCLSHTLVRLLQICLWMDFII